MARRGGFPGMGGGMNPQQMMKQMQKLQADMAKAQEEIHATEITASAGGGMVSVTMTGEHKLVNVSIKPDVVDPDDVEMLEDLVLAAVNEALQQVDALQEEKMGGFTGGMPGLF